MVEIWERMKAYLLFGREDLVLLGLEGMREGGTYVLFGNSTALYGAQREHGAPSFSYVVSAKALIRLLLKPNAGAEGAGDLCSYRANHPRWLRRGG